MTTFACIGWFLAIVGWFGIWGMDTQRRWFAASELDKMRKLRGDCDPAANCVECDLIRARIDELRGQKS